jgi:hypothetical protein
MRPCTPWKNDSIQAVAPTKGESVVQADQLPDTNESANKIENIVEQRCGGVGFDLLFENKQNNFPIGNLPTKLKIPHLQIKFQIHTP